MGVTVHLPAPLLPYADGNERIVLEGAPASVREALTAIRDRHPALHDRLLTEQGEVRPHVNVFVGGESIRFLDGLETKVGDGAEIHVIAAVSGG
jgi:molybdopterin converting factor small subunit